MLCSGQQRDRLVSSLLTVCEEVSKEIGIITFHDDTGRYDEAPEDSLPIDRQGLSDGHVLLVLGKVVCGNTQLAIAPLLVSP